MYRKKKKEVGRDREKQTKGNAIKDRMEFRKKTRKNENMKNVANGKKKDQHERLEKRKRKKRTKERNILMKEGLLIMDDIKKLDKAKVKMFMKSKYRRRIKKDFLYLS